MLEHTTLEKVTSFTQATELALSRLFTSAFCDQQAYIIDTSFKSTRCWDSGVYPTSRVKSKAVGRQTSRSFLPQIFWDPDPEHTLVEEDQEWVSLCPCIVAEKCGGLSVHCLAVPSMLPVASVR